MSLHSVTFGYISVHALVLLIFEYSTQKTSLIIKPVKLTSALSLLAIAISLAGCGGGGAGQTA